MGYGSTRVSFFFFFFFLRVGGGGGGGGGALHNALHNPIRCQSPQSVEVVHSTDEEEEEQEQGRKVLSQTSFINLSRITLLAMNITTFVSILLLIPQTSGHMITDDTYHCVYSCGLIQ